MSFPPTLPTPAERQASALSLLRLLHELLETRYRDPVVPAKIMDASERMLWCGVQEAEWKLRRYRTEKGLRTALDLLLPGWTDIDVSDYLPEDRWWNFVSNSRQEWEAHLRAEGLSEPIVQELCDGIDWAAP